MANETLQKHLHTHFRESADVGLPGLGCQAKFRVIWRLLCFGAPEVCPLSVQLLEGKALEME